MRRAEISDIRDIIELDKSVAGINRGKMIGRAVHARQCFVAANSSKLAAFGIMDYSFFGQGFINLLIVGNDFRRSGLAGRLIARLTDICRTEKIFTSTNRSNLPMQKVLDKYGFKQCGIINELDEGDPELVYYKRTREGKQGDQPLRVMP